MRRRLVKAKQFPSSSMEVVSSAISSSGSRTERYRVGCQVDSKVWIPRSTAFRAFDHKCCAPTRFSVSRSLDGPCYIFEFRLSGTPFPFPLISLANISHSLTTLFTTLLMSSKRGRKRNDNLPPNRARDVQRAFRARRAAHLQVKSFLRISNLIPLRMSRSLRIPL